MAVEPEQTTHEQAQKGNHCKGTQKRQREAGEKEDSDLEARLILMGTSAGISRDNIEYYGLTLDMRTKHVGLRFSSIPN